MAAAPEGLHTPRRCAPNNTLRGAPRTTLARCEPSLDVFPIYFNAGRAERLVEARLRHPPMADRNLVVDIETDRCYLRGTRD